jgi:hypothetical protein
MRITAAEPAELKNSATFVVPGSPVRRRRGFYMSTSSIRQRRAAGPLIQIARWISVDRLAVAEQDLLRVEKH